MADVKITALIQKKIDAIAEAASVLSAKQRLLITDFENVLQDVEHAFNAAANGEVHEDEEELSASELFQEDPIFDELESIASNLGGQIGGEYKSPFDFWIPSNC